MTVNYDKVSPSAHMEILKSDWIMQYRHSVMPCVFPYNKLK